ncbi:MAG: amidohydrolase family protein [Candidatus Bathyarchaeia archaeon]
MKIIDAHVHFPRSGNLEYLVERYEEAGVEKCFMCGLPRTELSNTAVHEALKDHPDLVKGFAYIDLDRDGLEAVDEAYSKGFMGIKLIAPLKPYDWEGYLQFYERIESRRMPILFHTGIVARGVKTIEKGVTSSNMRPICLETVARSFPKLNLIGAHLGHPWCEEAAVVSFHNPNVYFDISGGHTFYIALAIWRRLNYDLQPSKLLFGTDSSPENIQRYIDYWKIILPQIGLSEEDLESVFCRNAEQIISSLKA